MKGLYFYKLVSPYTEDVTKDCKLTVNEIDHNFITLKDGMVKTVNVDKVENHLVLELNNGDLLKAELPVFTKNVSAEFDKENGVITLKYDEVTKTFDGIFTTNNIKEYLDKYVKDYVLGRIEKQVVITDETLNGCGIYGMPLGLNIVEKTAYFKPVKKVIDKTDGNNNNLPSVDNVKTGDRYLTIEYYNPFGYLYTYNAAKLIEEDSKLNGWRIPTKSDWDGLLNAVELCDEDRNHSALTCNYMFGKVAGKVLKSVDHWLVESGHTCAEDCTCQQDYHEYVEQENEPMNKLCSTGGVDAYGMNILPSGYGCPKPDYFGKSAMYWTNTTTNVTDVYTKVFKHNKGGVGQMAESPNNLCSLRLVKDYDGSNFNGIEIINGVAYKTALMPSETSENGYAIWMAANAAFDSAKYCPELPNLGFNLSDSKIYYINEWNGFQWIKRAMTEGDSLVINNGPDNTIDNEFRIIEGKLVNANLIVVKEVINKYDTAIADVNARITVVDEKLNANIEVTNKLVEDLANEIERSTNEDEIIKGRLIKNEGSTYSCVDGILKLATEDPNNDITIALDSNYGTF